MKMIEIKANNKTPNEYIKEVKELFDNFRDEIVVKLKEFLPKLEKDGDMFDPHTLDNQGNNILRIIDLYLFSDKNKEVLKNYFNTLEKEAVPMETDGFLTKNNNIETLKNRYVFVEYDKERKFIKYGLISEKGGTPQYTNKKRGLNTAWNELVDTFNGRTKWNEIDDIIHKKYALFETETDKLIKRMNKIR